MKRLSQDSRVVNRLSRLQLNNARSATLLETENGTSTMNAIQMNVCDRMMLSDCSMGRVRGACVSQVAGRGEGARGGMQRGRGVAHPCCCSGDGKRRRNNCELTSLRQSSNFGMEKSRVVMGHFGLSSGRVSNSAGVCCGFVSQVASGAGLFESQPWRHAPSNAAGTSRCVILGSATCAYSVHYTR